MCGRDGAHSVGPRKAELGPMVRIDEVIPNLAQC